MEITIGHDGGGYYVEWYRDDDGGSGYGDHPEITRWYVGRGGSRADCERRARRKRPGLFLDAVTAI